MTENKNTELDPLWDIIGEGLRCAAELRNYLSVDEPKYLLFAGQALDDCRGYILYITLDEVKKASIHLMRLRDLLDEKDEKEEAPQQSADDSRLDRLLNTSLLEEQQMRVRRLLEALVTLVLFSSTNEQPYYRHLLLLEDLNQSLSWNKDLETFWGQRSTNVDDHIRSQVQWIRQVEGDVDLSSCWYLPEHERKPIKEPQKLRPGYILSGFHSRFKEALPLMTDTERIVAGYTYDWVFGSSSEAIHYRSNRRDYRPPEDPMFNVKRLGMLIYLILDRCYHILGKPDAPRFKRIFESLERSNSSASLHAATVGTGEVGDYVLVHGDIAQIMGIKNSDYGYRSYKVHYVAQRPKPNIPDDWFPAPYIQVFYAKKRFDEKWASYVKSGDLPEDIRSVLESVTEEELQLYLQQSMKDLWNIAIRSKITRQQQKDAE
jgi:hypothetical protein